MSRPILPVPSLYAGGLGRQPDPPLPSPNPGEQKRQYTKRGAISKIACRSCRRRKTKCNSERPTCQNCAARSENCIYDFDESDRSLTFLRDNVENLSEERNALEAVLQALQADSEDAATEIFRRLRSGGNITTLAQQVSATRASTGLGRDGSTGGSSSMFKLSHDLARVDTLTSQVIFRDSINMSNYYEQSPSRPLLNRTR